MASNVVKVTVSLSRGDMEKEEVRNIYASVYSQKKAVQNELRLVEEMLPSVLKVWPEY